MCRSSSTPSAATSAQPPSTTPARSSRAWKATPPPSIPTWASIRSKPFLEFENQGIYILCLTSNPGAADFQLHQDLYLKVARKVKQWNTRGNCGMVVGATKPQYLTSILAIAPDIPLLIPGLGTQGGDLEAILTAAPNLPRHHLLFNVSRSIIFAADDASFGRQARVVARYYQDMINKTRDKVMGHTQS